MAEFQYRTKTAACKICGSVFEFSHATGRHRATCSDQCAGVAAKDAAEKRPRLRCSESGCGTIARPGRLPICAMHYHRRYRTGTTHRDAPKHRWDSSGGYTLVCADHPMTRANGVAYEHRVVAFDHYGEGPHKCYWCGVELEWPEIAVDHLNEDKGDNQLANLVISCGVCNRHRSLALRFVRRLLPERADELTQMILAEIRRE